MSMDGKLLARARQALEDKHKQREEQLRQRRAFIYAKLPAVAETEKQLRLLMPAVIGAALGKGDAAARVREIEKQSLKLQARRAELLVQAGYPADYIDENPACKACGDSGYVRGKACSCLLAQYETELTKSLSDLFKLGDERFEAFRLDYYPSQPDPETGIAPRQQMSLVLEVCKAYAEHFGKESDSLLFQGGTGLGKTFLSACIARVVAMSGFSVVYETAVAAVAAFEAEKFARDETAAAQTQRLLGCDLLILDDLGTELTGAFTNSALYTLINSRLRAGKKTVISTNLTDAELRRRYTPAICSRLEGEYEKLSFVGTDIRALRRAVL